MISQLILPDENRFFNGGNLIFSTEGTYIHPKFRVIDTSLFGNEYVLIQRLLAHSLKIPLPVARKNDNNYGITVTLSGNILQVFEKKTCRERIKQQLMQLPKSIPSDIIEKITAMSMTGTYYKEYLPLYDLPLDACFVIRRTELVKLNDIPVNNKHTLLSTTRISTPLSRFLWLACKNNESIRPLIRQPYKLLSIFEQWASADGITDRLSGDTLKTALERGSPTSI